MPKSCCIKVNSVPSVGVTRLTGVDVPAIVHCIEPGILDIAVVVEGYHQDTAVNHLGPIEGDLLFFLADVVPLEVLESRNCGGCSQARDDILPGVDARHDFGNGFDLGNVAPHRDFRSAAGQQRCGQADRQQSP